MIIVCDSCGARFHLADGRVGPRGAKVRCSNCHHSFQVAPPGKGGAEPPKPENSPRPAAKRSKSAGGSGRPREVGDPDLDNPEFLFDEGEPTTATTVASDVPFSRATRAPRAAPPAPEAPVVADDDATPAGKRAPTPLMGLDPEVSARQEKLNQDLDRAAASLREEPPSRGGKNLFDFERNDDFEATPIPGREPSLTSPATSAGQDEEPDTLARIAGESVDESISRWDAPVPSSARPRRPEPKPLPGRRVEVLRTPDAPVLAAEQRVEEPPPTPRAELRPVALPDPDAAPAWMQLLAALVGLALIAAGARASLLHARAPRIEAASAEGLGWSASALRATPARDAAGDPAIEVEGTLTGPAGAPVPSVIVTPVDADGRPVGAGARAQARAPGFRALVAEQSASAHGFRIEIAPPPQAPRPLPQATTAAVPAPETEALPPTGGAESAAPPAAPEPAPPAR
jgi:predicted Zn finger-like uncharacterized protein